MPECPELVKTVQSLLSRGGRGGDFGVEVFSSALESVEVPGISNMDYGAMDMQLMLYND